MSLRLLSRAARPSTSCIALRPFSTTFRRSDVLSDLDKQINPREIIEQKKKLMEEKYAQKLKERAEQEGVQDFEELKQKIIQPKLDAEKAARDAKDAEREQARLAATEKVEDPVSERVQAERKKKEAKSQGHKDRTGVKPLADIINLPLIHLTPHDTNNISQIWNAFHTSHPTLSNAFLSASLPFETYASMLNVAKENPFFVLPLPRLSAAPVENADQPQIKTDEYEMFYLQWLFHPTPTSGSPASADASPKALPFTTSIIFTPLEEFKRSGEWAQPYLVLTHYPELSQTHNVVLMRGEISPASAGGPDGSLLNPGFLLSQQQAQLLALALQRFYCTDIALPGESEQMRVERASRKEALRGFRERPEEWDWAGLVEKSYGGLV